MSTYLPYYEEEERGYDWLREETYQPIICFCPSCTKPISADNLETFHCPKEWAKRFLLAWNRAVKLWNEGELFREFHVDMQYSKEQMRDQREYASLCVGWLIVSRFQEPHVVAQGLDDSPFTRAEIRLI